MPPKKKTPQAPKADARDKQNGVADDVTAGRPAKGEDQVRKTDISDTASKDAPETNVATDESSASKTAPKSKKRKQSVEADSSSKAPRRTGRSAKTEVSQQKLLNYLLSKDAEALLRPDDETKALQERGDIRTYSSSALNAFEELMCAMILARPISHMLGLRSIRTVLNEPYTFSNARAVKDAGEEKRLQALIDARTQHKGKTADQLGQAAEIVLEQFTAEGDKNGSELMKALSDNGGDWNKALKALKEAIKGLGDKGLDIFLRRVQWLPDWSGAYPYADGLSMDALRNIGLTQDVDELLEEIEKHWSTLATKHLAGDDVATRKRRALVVLLERATAAHLENKIREVQQAAAA